LSIYVEFQHCNRFNKVLNYLIKVFISTLPKQRWWYFYGFTRPDWQADAQCSWHVCSFFRPFIRLLQNLWTRYFKKNDFDVSRYKLPTGQRQETIKFRVKRSKVKLQGHTKPKIDLEAWQRHHPRLPLVE